MPQVPQVHQSCVRTELSAVNGQSLRFKYSPTPVFDLAQDGFDICGHGVPTLACIDNRDGVGHDAVVEVGSDRDLGMRLEIRYHRL